MALVLRTFGAVLIVRGHHAEAERVLRRGLASLQRAGRGPHPDEGDFFNRLAYLTVQRGAPDAASVYKDAVVFDRARPPGDPYFATDGYEYLAMTAARMGDKGLADTLFRRAAALYGRELSDGHPYRVQTAAGLRALSMP